MDHFEHQFQSLIDDQTIIGLALAVVQNGEVTYSTSLGVTGVEDYQLPITLDTLFPIGSITKTIAAATILRLVEQGILDLDLPIVHYLNGFKFEDEAYGRQITLRHLLSHSSGLPAAGRYWGKRGREALKTFVWEDLRLHRFVAPPGHVYLYSNTAISCAGYVAEVVTGTPFDKLVQQLVFEPLGMKRSTFNLAEAMTYPIALSHQMDQDANLQVIHRLTDNDMGHPSSFCYCSTRDLAKFSAALLTSGELLQAETLRTMQTPAISLHTTGANYPGGLMNAAYGLGLNIGEYRGCRMVRHGGMNLSCACFLDIFPDQQTAVILQTNYMRDERALNILFELYDTLLKPTKPLRPPAPPELPYAVSEDLLGEYLNPETGIQTLSEEGGQYLLNGQDQLICIGDGQFYYQSGSLRFPVAFPHPDTLIVRGVPYFRHEPISFTPDFTQWQSYVGKYIDVFTPYPDKTAIQVHFKNDKLWTDDMPQIALSNSQFVSPNGLIEFVEADMLQVGKGMRFVRSVSQ